MGVEQQKAILWHFDRKRERDWLDLQHREESQRGLKLPPQIRSRVQPTRGEKVLGSLVQVK